MKVTEKVSCEKGNRELRVLTGWSAPGALMMLLLVGSWVRLSLPVSQKRGKTLGNRWSTLSRGKVRVWRHQEASSPKAGVVGQDASVPGGRCCAGVGLATGSDGSRRQVGAEGSRFSNGNCRDVDRSKDEGRSTRSGMCVGIIRSNRRGGRVVLHRDSDLPNAGKEK